MTEIGRDQRDRPNLQHKQHVQLSSNLTLKRRANTFSNNRLQVQLVRGARVMRLMLPDLQKHHPWDQILEDVMLCTPLIRGTLERFGTAFIGAAFRDRSERVPEEPSTLHKYTADGHLSLQHEKRESALS